MGSPVPFRQANPASLARALIKLGRAALPGAGLGDQFLG